jgi:hypothetical protein
MSHAFASMLDQILAKNEVQEERERYHEDEEE